MNRSSSCFGCFLTRCVSGINTTCSLLLDDLRLENNQITGTIPAEIITNKKLRKSSTRCGSKPGCLAWLYPNSVWFVISSTAGLMYLGNNHLTGKIPEIFDDLRTLSKSEFGCCCCWSPLFSIERSRPNPPWILHFDCAADLELHNNKLIGRLPSTFGDLTDLRKYFLECGLLPSCCSFRSRFSSPYNRTSISRFQ